MMAKRNSSFPTDWMNIAFKDWRRAKRMLDVKDAEAAGFFLQQSLEKFIKAFLLAQGWKLRKIHELDALLDDAVKLKLDLEKFRDLCELVSGYYLAERYPIFSAAGLSCEDIKENILRARKFIKMMFPAAKINAPK
jgi:HEPN domain-containing protein